MKILLIFWSIQVAIYATDLAEYQFMGYYSTSSTQLNSSVVSSSNPAPYFSVPGKHIK